MLQGVYEPFHEPKLARGSARCQPWCGTVKFAVEDQRPELIPECVSPHIDVDFFPLEGITVIVHLQHRSTAPRTLCPGSHSPIFMGQCPLQPFCLFLRRQLPFDLVMNGFPNSDDNSFEASQQ